jgi:hypothetical protein
MHLWHPRHPRMARGKKGSCIHPPASERPRTRLREKSACWQPIHTKDNTVMCPWTPSVAAQVVKSNNQQQGLDTPSLNPSTDTYSWVNAVTEWTELFAQGATSGINRAYTGQLYRALPHPNQQILDNVQAEGQIDYKRENQLRALKEIFDLLGK